jgi:hypothetical protein
MVQLSPNTYDDDQDWSSGYHLGSHSDVLFGNGPSPRPTPNLQQ